MKRVTSSAIWERDMSLRDSATWTMAALTSCMQGVGLTDRVMVLPGLREQGQVFAGGVLLLAPTMASAAAAAEVMSPLRQLMWCSRSWGVQGLANGAPCSG